MEFSFRLGPGNIISSGVGVVFLAAGLAILVLGGASRRARLVGAFTALWGLSTAVQNLVGYGEPERALDLVLELGAFVALAALIAHVAAPLTGAARVTFGSLIAVTALGIAFFAYGSVERLVDDRPFDQWSNFAVSALMPSTLVLLIAACVLRSTTGDPDARRSGRGWLLLGLSSGLYAAFFTARSAALPTSLETHGVVALNISGFVLASVLCVVVYLVIAARKPPDPAASRWTFAALLASALLGCLTALHEDAETFGATRFAGVILLAVAITKYDLLGVPLPKLALRRSVVGGAALATLFMVAQIAQNFLAAEYGLLMGGLVAGAFLFAAQPIQRAFERVSLPTTPSVPARPDDSHEEVFLSALRIAMRDKRLTREEEIHLHRLATKLGIDAGRAHELLIQAERETAAKRRRGA